MFRHLSNDQQFDPRVLETGTSKPFPNTLYLDILRCIAIIGVLGVHFLISLKLSSAVFLPSSQGLQENLFSLLDYNNQNITLLAQLPQLFFKFGWQGVHLFLFISGFGLYYSYLRSTDQKELKYPSRYWLTWFKKRLNRVLPKYWIVISIIFVTKMGLSFLDWIVQEDSPKKLIILPIQYIASFFLLRNFTQATFFSLAGALWYIPLIVGLYMTFPVIIYWVKHKNISLEKILLWTIIISLVYRFIINVDPCAYPVPFQVPDVCINPWHWNLQHLFSHHVTYGLFIARIPGFVLGIYAAQLYQKGTLDHWFLYWQNRCFLFIAGFIIWVLGNVTSYYKLTWPLCDFLISLGLIMLFSSVLYFRTYSLNRLVIRGIKGLSSLSYELFLIHQFIFFLLNNLIQPSHLGYVSFLIILLSLLLGLSILLNTSCRNLRIDDFPGISNLCQFFEHKFKLTEDHC